MTGVPRPTRKSQTITLMVPPSANDRLLLAQDRTTGKYRMFNTGLARKYKRGQAQMLAFLKPVPAPRDVRVDVIWHMRPGEKGDLDNVLKILIDTLSGHAFDDDAQVAELVVSRIRGQRQSKVVVTVEDLTPQSAAPQAMA